MTNKILYNITKDYIRIINADLRIIRRLKVHQYLKNQYNHLISDFKNIDTSFHSQNYKSYDKNIDDLKRINENAKSLYDTIVSLIKDLRIHR